MKLWLTMSGAASASNSRLPPAPGRVDGGFWAEGEPAAAGAGAVAAVAAVREAPERACTGATDRGAATGTTGTAFGAGVRIMPMTLGAEAGTATGGRAAAGAGLATGAEFSAAGWPIKGAGLATGTFVGT